MPLPRHSGCPLVAALAFLLPLAIQSEIPRNVRSFEQAYGDAQRLYDQKRYAEAAALLEPFYEAGPAHIGRLWYTAMYDLACEEALAGHSDKALEVLAASQANGGSTGADHIASDADLASLRNDPRFKRLVEDARSRERLWIVEPGQDVPYTATLSEDAKIAGLSTLWAEARFNFAFFERQPTLDWNQLFVASLPEVRATKSTEAYYRLLMRLAAQLQDGHTNVYPPEALTDAFYGGPGLRTLPVQDQVVVTEVYDPALAAKGWRVGDVIRGIGDESVKQYAEREVAPFQSSSTPQDMEVRTFGYALLNGKAGTSITVTVEDAQGRQTVRQLTRLPVAQRLRLRHVQEASFSLRTDGIAVLVVNEFEDAKGAELLLNNLPEVNASKGLIIDVRANGGGSTPVDLLRILAKAPFPGAMQRTRLYRAADRARGALPGWDDVAAENVPIDEHHHLQVPVSVLTSARTFSAAEDFVAAFVAMRRGMTVGEPTGGSTGQPLSFQLPGGGSGRVGTESDRAGDGTIFEGKGLTPGVSSSPTILSIRTGQDPTLERAAALLLTSN